MVGGGCNEKVKIRGFIATAVREREKQRENRRKKRKKRKAGNYFRKQ